MTSLPVATINVMPSQTPMEACARVSLGLVKYVTMHGHLKGCLADLWRRTRLCCSSTTRHLDSDLFKLRSIENGRIYCKGEKQTFYDAVEAKSIRRDREGKRNGKGDSYPLGLPLGPFEKPLAIDSSHTPKLDYQPATRKHGVCRLIHHWPLQTGGPMRG